MQLLQKQAAELQLQMADTKKWLEDVVANAETQCPQEEPAEAEGVHPPMPSPAQSLRSPHSAKEGEALPPSHAAAAELIRQAEAEEALAQAATLRAQEEQRAADEALAAAGSRIQHEDALEDRAGEWASKNITQKAMIDAAGADAGLIAAKRKRDAGLDIPDSQSLFSMDIRKDAMMRELAVLQQQHPPPQPKPVPVARTPEEEREISQKQMMEGMRLVDEKQRSEQNARDQELLRAQQFYEMGKKEAANVPEPLPRSVLGEDSRSIQEKLGWATKAEAAPEPAESGAPSTGSLPASGAPSTGPLLPSGAPSTGPSPPSGVPSTGPFPAPAEPITVTRRGMANLLARVKNNPKRLLQLPKDLQRALHDESKKSGLIDFLMESNGSLDALAVSFEQVAEKEATRRQRALLEPLTEAEVRRVYGDKAEAVMAAKVEQGLTEKDPNLPLGQGRLFLMAKNVRQGCIHEISLCFSSTCHFGQGDGNSGP